MVILLLALSLAIPTYRPPVDAPVIDPFALPDGPYGAGNRGLVYATTPGVAVRAIGDGLVVFAGPVAGRRWVTVLHPDGLRSSYGPLARIDVDVGERLARGQPLGVAGELLHLGVRSGGTYLDPATLFDDGGVVHLVPLNPDAVPLDDRPGSGAGRAAGTLVARS